MITLFVNILVPVNCCKKITSGFGPKARLKFILPNCCISFCKIFCRIAVLWFRTVLFQCNNLIGCNILMVNKNLDGIKNALVQIDRRPFFYLFNSLFTINSSSFSPHLFQLMTYFSSLLSVPFPIRASDGTDSKNEKYVISWYQCEEWLLELMKVPIPMNLTEVPRVFVYIKFFESGTVFAVSLQIHSSNTYHFNHTYIV